MASQTQDMKGEDQELGSENVANEGDSANEEQEGEVIVPVTEEFEEETEIAAGEEDLAVIEARNRTRKTKKLKNDPEEIARLTETLKSYDMMQLKEFVLKPVPQGVWLECHIKRISTGITKFSRKFSMFTDSGVFLCSSKKRPWVKNKTSNYAVSVDSEDIQSKGDAFVGKIRSNFLGSEFMAYGEGPNPKNLKDGENPRSEVAAIQYSSHLMGKKPKGPRKITVVLPAVDASTGEALPCNALDPAKDGLIALMEHHSQMTATEETPQLVTTYCSKNARWNEKMKSFVLNFDSRVAEASVKNFQLIKQDDPDTVYLQFGRVSKDTFNLDFRSPLSPMQAFSLAISSFDYKICSE